MFSFVFGRLGPPGFMVKGHSEPREKNRGRDEHRLEKGGRLLPKLWKIGSSGDAPAPRNTASTSVGMSHCFWFSARTAATASPRASNSSAFLGNGFRFIIIFASFWARFNFAPHTM